MFDANYFRTGLPRDVAAAGGQPIVEVQLLGGHAHRVRAVIDVADGYVTLETYQAKGDFAHERPRYTEAPATSGDHETYRTVIAYASIAAVTLDPAPVQARTRTGFLHG